MKYFKANLCKDKDSIKPFKRFFLQIEVQVTSYIMLQENKIPLSIIVIELFENLHNSEKLSHKRK